MLRNLRQYQFPRVTRIGLCLFVAAAACNGPRSTWRPDAMRTSDEWMKLALESPKADERRAGIDGLSASRDGAADWALTIYTSVARTDIDPMVRCAGLAALQRHDLNRAAEVATVLLMAKDAAPPDVRPAPASVRWSAARVLCAAGADDASKLTQSRGTVDVLVRAAESDASHQVRLTAIDCLGHVRDSRVPPVLIDLLEDQDFAVRRAAESSLVALTGETHHYDAAAWRAWLAGAGDPFAGAGRTPAGWDAHEDKPRWDWIGIPGAG